MRLETVAAGAAQPHGRNASMKTTHLIALPVLALCMVMDVSAVEREAIDAYIGRELFVETGFAGASITIGRDGEDYVICHRVFGSGRPIVSAKVYPASKRSDWQLRFKTEEDNNFILTVSAPGKLEILLNGYKLLEPRVADRADERPCSED